MVAVPLIFGTIGALIGLLGAYGMSWTFDKTGEDLNMQLSPAWTPDWVMIALLSIVICGAVGLIAGAIMDGTADGR